MIKPLSTSSNGNHVKSSESNSPNNQASTDSSIHSPTMASELDLSNMYTQINLTQLALLEKNQSNSTTNGAFNQLNMNGNLNSFLHNSSVDQQNTDEFTNFFTGELNNNNPSVVNNNLIANTTNSSNCVLQFSDNSNLLNHNYSTVHNLSNSNQLYNSTTQQSSNQQSQLQQLQPNLPNLTSRMMNCSPVSNKSNSPSLNQQSNIRSKPRSVQIKHKFGRLGHGNGELSSPHGFCLGANEEIIIADTFNHRVCIFDMTGRFKQQFGHSGKDEGKLWYPRKVALIKTPPPSNQFKNEPRFVVCDRGSERSRMQIFSRDGEFLSRIIIKYIDIVAGLVVTPEGHIVAVDSVSARLFVIHENGELLKSFRCGGDMQEPSDIAVFDDHYYICDFKGHCVVVFNSDGQFVRKIGDNKITNYPNGIDIDVDGRILASDSHGNKFHIVVYDQMGKLLGEYECPYAKVSRCCGLKITRDGYIVTLAKNNHHVLVLDALNNVNNNNVQSPMMNNKQLLPILNSTSQHPQITPAASKEGIDFNDQMIQYNLTLLANFCDTNSAANNQLKSLVNLNNNDSLTPNHNLIAQQQNNANNSMTNSFIKSPSMHPNNNSVIQSSTLNTSLLEQHLQELSFNESLLNTQNNHNTSFNLSKASNDARLNDSSIAVSNELNSISHMNMSNSFASPTSDHSSSGLPTTSTKNGKNVMAIRSKFGHLGSNQGQFSSPHGFCLGVDEEIVIADTYNHRICVFEKDGKFSYQFGLAGKEEGELWHPRKVAVTKILAGSLSFQQQQQPKFVVCDRGNEKSRMQLFSRSGTFIRKISIRYIDIVAGLAITPTNNIVAVDSVMPTVFIISETGELTKWFDCSKYMREPSDIAINGDLYYICDFKGHYVVVFNENGHYLQSIGGESITKFPNGIDVSDYGDILVGDSHGNRFHVVVFDKNGKTLSEFECPYVKVSRCCGLKITSEGYVVTLAKNNHHVLVLNTLYIV